MTIDLTPLGFGTDAGFGVRATLGLIVLETDQTVEPELNSLALDGVVTYHSRIPMEVTVSSSTLNDMLERLPRAAALLPADFGFDAIGYACTSAATVIGADAVKAAVQSAHPGVSVTDPISAAIAGFESLGVERIGLVTPYVAEVTEKIVATFGAAGIEVVAAGSFLEPSDLVVARITPEAIAASVRQIYAQASGPVSVDAMFVSCTSLRTLSVLSMLEAELGVPVVSSNQAFGWHLLRLAGIEDAIDGFGTLLTRPG